MARYLIHSISWPSDGTQIAAGYEYGSVYIWDIFSRGYFPYNGYVGNFPINAIAWSPDGAYIASASYNIQVWLAPQQEALSDTN